MARTKTYTTKDNTIILRYTKDKTVIYKAAECVAVE